MLRVRPGHNITHESFVCQLLDPINVSSSSMFEDGEELISSIVHVAPDSDDTYEVRHSSTILLIFGFSVSVLFGSIMISLDKISPVMYDHVITAVAVIVQMAGKCDQYIRISYNTDAQTDQLQALFVFCSRIISS